MTQPGCARRIQTAPPASTCADGGRAAVWRQPERGAIEHDGERLPVPARGRPARRPPRRRAKDQQDQPALPDPRPERPSQPAGDPAQRAEQEQLLGGAGGDPGPPCRRRVRWGRHAQRRGDAGSTRVEPPSPQPGGLGASILAQPIVGRAEIVPVRRDGGLACGPVARTRRPQPRARRSRTGLGRWCLRPQAEDREHDGEQTSTAQAPCRPPRSDPPSRRGHLPRLTGQRGVLRPAGAGSVSPGQQPLAHRRDSCRERRHPPLPHGRPPRAPRAYDAPGPAPAPAARPPRALPRRLRRSHRAAPDAPAASRRSRRRRNPTSSGGSASSSEPHPVAAARARAASERRRAQREPGGRAAAPRPSRLAASPASTSCGSSAERYRRRRGRSRRSCTRRQRRAPRLSRGRRDSGTSWCRRRCPSVVPTLLLHLVAVRPQRPAATRARARATARCCLPRSAPAPPSPLRRPAPTAGSPGARATGGADRAGEAGGAPVSRESGRTTSVSGRLVSANRSS